jgi:hypothetical protein
VTLTGMPGGRRRAVDRTRRARHAAPTRNRRRLTRTHLVRATAIIATVVLMAAIVTLAAILTYRHAGPKRPATASTQTPVPAPSSATFSATIVPPPPALNADFAELENTLHAKMGVVVSAVGSGQQTMTFGDWQEGPAWSTIKVPLVIAAYRQSNPQQVTDAMKAAITESDNAAAEKLWGQLGEPTTAAQRVQQVLQDTGDPTTVESRKVRPEFTAFGQTIWSLVNQVRFTASAVCTSANDPIFNLMSQVEPSQSWGIGNTGIPGTEFKGGWGPSPSGKYLVRQIGVLTVPAGKIALAIAAEPASGSFDDGTHDLDEVAKWLTDHLGSLPVGGCGR